MRRLCTRSPAAAAGHDGWARLLLGPRPAPLLRALQEQGWHRPLPVQAAAVPRIMAGESLAGVGDAIIKIVTDLGG